MVRARAAGGMMQEFCTPYLDIKLNIQRQGGLREEVALEVGEEAVELAAGAALVEVAAAGLQQRAYQPHPEV